MQPSSRTTSCQRGTTARDPKHSETPQRPGQAKDTAQTTERWGPSNKAPLHIGLHKNSLGLDPPPHPRVCAKFEVWAEWLSPGRARQQQQDREAPGQTPNKRPFEKQRMRPRRIPRSLGPYRRGQKDLQKPGGPSRVGIFKPGTTLQAHQSPATMGPDDQWTRRGDWRGLPSKECPITKLRKATWNSATISACSSSNLQHRGRITDLRTASVPSSGSEGSHLAFPAGSARGRRSCRSGRGNEDEPTGWGRGRGGEGGWRE